MTNACKCQIFSERLAGDGRCLFANTNDLGHLKAMSFLKSQIASDRQIGCSIMITQSCSIHPYSKLSIHIKSLPLWTNPNGIRPNDAAKKSRSRTMRTDGRLGAWRPARQRLWVATSPAHGHIGPPLHGRQVCLRCKLWAGILEAALVFRGEFLLASGVS